MRVSVTHTSIFLVLAACGHPSARATGPLPEDAYVWQLETTSGMADVIAKEGPSFREIAALAADVGWKEGAPAVDRSDADLAGRGAVVHIAPFSGDFAAVTPAIVAAARDVAARHPIEIQVAFEAEADQIPEYAGWVAAIRSAVSPLPVVVAASADWLESSDLPALLASSDGWMLQIRSFGHPTSAEELAPIPDSSAIEADIEAAARLGRPFRVALPTHDFVADLTSSGELIGIRGVDPIDPTPGRVPHVIRAEPAAIAAVVRHLQADRPAACTGIAWFRLPSPLDAAAWRSVTLAEVRAGRVPRGRQVTGQVRRGAAVDVAIENVGTDDIMPRPVGFAGGTVQALVGWRVDGNRIRPSPDTVPLRPGERRVIGFARTGGGFALWNAD
jgi:hypothetical protein